MKSYTDLEQSKKLAEILPIESADMCYRIVAYNPNDTHVYQPYCFLGTLESDIPCWSLAAIIELLPYDIKGHNLAIHKSYCPNEKNFAYELSYEGNFYDYEPSILVSTSSIELIDACVEMIEKLKEKGIL